ncbi:MAG: hypothetical protein ACQEUZ_06245 [Pseudomonadota bacterium]
MVSRTKAKKLRKASGGRTRLDDGGITPPARAKNGNTIKDTRRDARWERGQQRCILWGWAPTPENIREAGRRPPDDDPLWAAFYTGGLGAGDTALFLAKAGEVYARERAEYFRLCIGRSQTAVVGGYGAAQGRTLTEPDDDLVRAVRDAHSASHAVLVTAGMLAEREVVRICCEQDVTAPAKLPPLRDGLRALMPWYREKGMI